MKLLIALAFIALASAAPEVSAPSAVKVVDAPTLSEDISPIKVVDAPESAADEASPVKVIDAPLDVPQVEVPKISPENMYRDVRSLIDISPAFVANDVEEAGNIKVVDGPVDSKVPVGIVPREMWRGPAPIELPKVPAPAPKPTHWRDLPQEDFRPVYHFDNILR